MKKSMRGQLQRSLPRLVPAIAACAAALIATASPAHADDQSFLDDLHSHSVGTGIMNPPTGVALGHIMCDRIRGGMSPGDAAQLPRGPFIDGMGIVGAAQHQLCPDTLH